MEYPPIVSAPCIRMHAFKLLLKERLKDFISGNRVIFCDRPVYLNVGDMLIDLGTRKILKELGAEIIFQCSLLDYKQVSKLSLPDDVVLVFQGGGNLGDIYPRHDELRKTLLSAFPHNPVLMMPQSIHYQQEANCKALTQLFQSRNAHLILLRDKPSLDFMSTHAPGCNAQLCPDAAVALFEPSKQEHRIDNTLVFRRRDVESTATAPHGSDTFDWPDLMGFKQKLLFKLTKRSIKTQQLFQLNRPGYAMLDVFQAEMYRAATLKFRTAGCIDTDRLHGMILAQLLGLPFIARDNSYGKLGRYLDAWPC